MKLCTFFKWWPLLSLAAPGLCMAYVFTPLFFPALPLCTIQYLLKVYTFTEDFLKNIPVNLEIESKRDALWFAVPSHSSHFLLFLCVCSLSISLLLVPALSSAFASPKGTEESVAAGHTCGLESVLLFGPWWCLLCKMCRGGMLVLRRGLSCSRQHGSTMRRPNKAAFLQNMSYIDWMNVRTTQSREREERKTIGRQSER